MDGLSPEGDRRMAAYQADADAEAVPTPFAPAELAHAVALELVEPAAEKGLWLDSTADSAVPPRALGDAAAIRRVLRTLAERALAATDHGHIAVSLTAEHTGAGRWTLVFTVTDTGPDLTPEQRRALSEGLPPGAAGRIGCNERLGGGNHVWYAVPVRALDPAAGEPPPPGRDDRLEHLLEWASRRNGRVLVVDDSATNRIITAALLTKSGFGVTLADGGAAAVRTVAEAAEPFDAVLMDVAMPEVDGLAATAAIRALPGPQGRVPILAVTAHAFPEDRARCLAAGMDGYLAKPFQKQDLLELLAQHLAPSV